MLGMKLLSAKKKAFKKVVVTYEGLRQQIRELAYKKWEDAGCPWGQDKEFWLEAEEELFGENAVKNGGYILKSRRGNVIVCPLSNENPMEIEVLV